MADNFRYVDLRRDNDASTLERHILEVDVENEGGGSGEVSVSAERDGSEMDVETLDLDSGDEATAVLEVDPSTSPSDWYRADVLLDGEQVTGANIDYVAPDPPEFDVWIDDYGVSSGSVWFGYAVENVGDEEGDVRVSVVDAEDAISRVGEFTLGPGEVYEGDSSNSVSSAGEKDIAVIIRHDGEQVGDARGNPVVEDGDLDGGDDGGGSGPDLSPGFRYVDIRRNNDASTPERHILEVDVENVGGGSGEVSVSAERDGSEMGVETLDLDSGGEATAVLEVDPSTSPSDFYRADVLLDGEQVTGANIDYVEPEPPEFLITGVEEPDPLDPVELGLD